MEKWIAGNLGTVLTIMSLVIGFAMSYAKLRSQISELELKVQTMSLEFEKLRSAGVPFVCPLHEKRLTTMEQEITRMRETLSEDINAIKGLISTSHDLILNLQRTKANI